MKIKRELVAEMTLGAFADKHGLTMVVRERSQKHGSLARFYASFEHTDVKGDGVIIGRFGDGGTEENAIRNYAQKISEETLVVDAHGPGRKEIRAPRIVEEA